MLFYSYSTAQTDKYTGVIVNFESEDFEYLTIFKDSEGFNLKISTKKHNLNEVHEIEATVRQRAKDFLAFFNLASPETDKIIDDFIIREKK